MIRSTFGRGRYVVNEDDVVLGTALTFAGQRTAGAIFCHGSGDLVAQPLRDQTALLYGVARQASMFVSDLGGDTFCNDTAVTRIGQAITYLRTTWGQTGPVALIGMSMGAGNALKYAREHPEDVSCVAGVIPLTDLADAHARGVGAGIDAAYGGTYDDETDGPTHSPIQFAGDLDTDLPIHLWSAGGDIFTPEEVTQAFVLARPQTGFTSVGPLGHTDAAVTAATPSMVQFVLDHV